MTRGNTVPPPPPSKPDAKSAISAYTEMASRGTHAHTADAWNAMAMVLVEATDDARGEDLEWCVHYAYDCLGHARLVENAKKPRRPAFTRRFDPNHRAVGLTTGMTNAQADRAQHESDHEDDEPHELCGDEGRWGASER